MTSKFRNFEHSTLFVFKTRAEANAALVPDSDDILHRARRASDGKMSCTRSGGHRLRGLSNRFRPDQDYSPVRGRAHGNRVASTKDRTPTTTRCKWPVEFQHTERCVSLSCGDGCSLRSLDPWGGELTAFLAASMPYGHALPIHVPDGGQRLIVCGIPSSREYNPSESRMSIEFRVEIDSNNDAGYGEGESYARKT